VRRLPALLLLSLLSSCFPYQMNACLKGEKVGKIDILKKESISYLKKGYKEGYFCYGYALLLEKKPKRAIPYLLEAYRKGFKKASYYLGKAYLKLRDRKKAAYWFFRAIEDGYINRDFFETADYISKKELDTLYKLGRKHPVIYLYLGDYFFKNELYDAALYYYQLAIRYGFERAKLMAGLSLYRLGNRREALNTLYSLYREGNRNGAEAIATLIEREADLLGNCTILKAKTPEAFVKERARIFKEKAELYRLSAKFYTLASDEKSHIRALKKVEFYSPDVKGKELLPSGSKAQKLPEEVLKKLCEKGEEWAELLLSERRGRKFFKAAEEFYRAMGFKINKNHY